MIDGQNVFDQPVKNDLKTYDKLRKITIGEEDNYKLIALDTDPGIIHQISFTRNLN